MFQLTIVHEVTVLAISVGRVGKGFICFKSWAISAGMNLIAGDFYSKGWEELGNLEEAVQQLWRRRDEADKLEIASLRAASRLPIHEGIFYISSSSDDYEIGPL
ncbi:PHD finger family protein [Forsythia ovata]|uniref:PHD finger family protein n=1 Tax=Forsythia ovata TaxID=205694 RepID=A0ABD1TP66_9LAMI